MSLPDVQYHKECLELPRQLFSTQPATWIHSLIVTNAG